MLKDLKFIFKKFKFVYRSYKLKFNGNRIYLEELNAKLNKVISVLIIDKTLIFWFFIILCVVILIFL